MKTITKADLPRIRALIAQKFPVDRTVTRKWERVSGEMGTVPVSQTARELKLVVFLSRKAQTIIVDEIAYRGQEGTLRALDRMETIETQASELLSSLEG